MRYKCLHPDSARRLERLSSNGLSPSTCTASAECTRGATKVCRTSEGRGTLTQHLTRRDNQLADVTIFINPGTGSNGTAKTQIADAMMRETLRALVRGTLTDAFWTDGQGRSATTHTIVHGVTLGNASLLRQTCLAKVETACSLRRCPFRTNLPCVNRCTCNDPGEYRHDGPTLANVVAVKATLVASGNESMIHRAALLPPARPASFTHWACEHLAISPNTFRRCGWSPSAIFAVGSTRVSRHPRETYSGIANLLGGAGVTGGVGVHYMERLWRSLFVCNQ